MSAIKLRNVALSHFARYGYEGASLSKIAEEVGIKKPTIYSHYKSKEDLFLSVVKYVFHLEKRQIFLYFQKEDKSDLKSKLEGFFDWFEAEFNLSDTTKFLLRMSYFPPPALRNEMFQLSTAFIDGMERLLYKMMKQHQIQGELNGINMKDAALAYLTLVDGVIVELLFAGTNRYKKRADVAFPIYWRGIHSINKEYLL